MEAIVGRQGSPFYAQFLTGDQNIVSLQAVVHFTVRDPVKFLLPPVSRKRQSNASPNPSLAKEISQTPVDDILTVGKIAIQNRTRSQVQQVLDEIYNLGMTVVALTVQKVSPSDQVKDAFESETKARQNRHRRILAAQSYANTVIPKARGEAQKILNEAIAYRDKVIAEAEGNADKFLALLAEYRKAKDVTASRLYLEAMEECSRGSRK
ncbi:MAG: FtsH protease activity modulator HflK [Candidatus Fervidibacter sp.]|uniref:FtsH protease activity modulator HflK n=1 Tax=Candidatus Fervidibacter sp. TaxID=3100871 RepID=UPI00404A77DF